MSKTPSTKPLYDLETRTLNFAKNVIQLCRNLKQEPSNRVLISQAVRACGSIGANYREANEALSKKDFAHRIKIARKEAKEAYYWLELIEAANPDIDGQVKPLLQESRELRSILSAIAKKAE